MTKKTLTQITITALALTLSACAGTSSTGRNNGFLNGNPQMGGEKTMETSTPQPPAGITPEQSQQLLAGESDHSPKKLEFDITGGNYYFSPTVIHAKKGDSIKIKFTNNGGMHNLIIDEYKVKTDTIKDGETTTTGFTADTKGTFEFYCGIGNHRAMGMKGVLIIE